MAAEIELQVVRLPERGDVELTMVESGKIPRAQMKAKIRYEEGQARIEISYENMKPAVLFGGDVTCYVLWAVNRDGTFENLGELWVRPERDKDTLQFSTGLRTFALLVTGEPYYQVARPSGMILFRNDRSSQPQAPSDRLLFSALGPAPASGIENLAAVRYDRETLLDIVQAERVYGIAARLKAQEYSPKLYGEAGVSLQQARAASRSSGSQRGAQEYARRSVVSSNEAIKITLRALEEKALEERIAQRQAEIQELEQRAVEADARSRRLQAEAETTIASLAEQKQQAEAAVGQARGQLQQTQGELQQTQGELQQVRQERMRMESEKTALESVLGNLRTEQSQLRASLGELQKEKSVLEGRLQQALSQVAETRESARGFIVNLPDILFDVNQATLKPQAQTVIAKLAGILLIMQDLNLRIEGHTDSTGSASYNLQLSRARADSVFNFLVLQGIASTRITTVGLGLERPIADNSTAEGRERNRRVEIVIGEGRLSED